MQNVLVASLPTLLDSALPASASADCSDVLQGEECNDYIRTDSANYRVIFMWTLHKSQNKLKSILPVSSLLLEKNGVLEWISDIVLVVYVSRNGLDGCLQDWFMLRQIGPPPPPEAPPGIQLQFSLFRQTRMQTYLIDIVNTGFEGLGICGAKVEWQCSGLI